MFRRLGAPQQLPRQTLVGRGLFELIFGLLMIGMVVFDRVSWAGAAPTILLGGCMGVVRGSSYLLALVTTRFQRALEMVSLLLSIAVMVSVVVWMLG